MKASEAQLETASSSCEGWGIGCAALVVVAIAVEFLLAYFHPTYDSPWNRWVSTIADAAIALGIVGEVAFGRLDGRLQTELRSRSNDKLSGAIDRLAQVEFENGFFQESAAKANERAEEANRKANEASLELVKYRSRRTVLAEDMWKIAESIKAFPGMTFDVCTGPADQEIFGLLDQILVICAWGAWEFVDWPFPDGVMHGQHMIGTSATSLNVMIGCAFNARPQVSEASNALATGLAEAGIAAYAQVLNVALVAPDDASIVHIRIGRKT
jgi:hypothetical protein